MFPTEINAEIQAKIRVLQTIAGALIMGVATFAVIAVVVGGQNATAPAPPPVSGAGSTTLSTTDVLRYAAGATLFCGIIAAFIVNALSRKVPANIDAGDDSVQRQLFARYFIFTIISLALLEGPALFGAVVVLLGGNAMDLILVAIPVIGMIALFPTAGKFQRIVDSVRGARLEPISRR